MKSYYFLLLLFLSACTKQSDEKVLNVYNWANYIGKDTISSFEEEFGARVNYDNFSNNEELLAKLQAGASEYDVVVPTDYMVQIMVHQDLLSTIDPSKLSNFKNLDKKFVNRDYDPKNQHCVPYFWSNAGIAVNTKYVKESVDSWNILWNEKYKGKISMLDDPRTSLLPALFKLGAGMNVMEPKIIDEAKELLMKQKPLVKTYTSDIYIELLKNEEVWIAEGYIGDVYQVKATKPEITYILPKEGSEIAIDNLCIPKKAPHPELASQFLNFILRADVAAKIANDIHYPSPNEAARAFIDPTMLTDKNVYPPDEVLQRLHFTKDLGSAFQLYDRAWSEVKAY